MDVAVIGLGRMGSGMGERLARHGHKVAGHDLNAGRQKLAEEAGLIWMTSPSEASEKLAAPRAVIIMVPAGPPVQQAIDAVLPALSPGDVIIDGGNSFYKDSVFRAAGVEKIGVDFLDAGVSGGVWGLEEGYCLMVGGKEEAYKRVEPIFADLAPEGGHAYVGKSGAGHFAKMIHNGIEYGMLQAYAEGFEVLKESQYDYDLAGLAKLWGSGSVVRSWLLELAQRAYVQHGNELDEIRDWIADSGEGRWTVLEAIQESVPTPVIALSLMMRFRSRQDESYGAKLIAALRGEFGGHEVKHE